MTRHPATALALAAGIVGKARVLCVLCGRLIPSGGAGWGRTPCPPSLGAARLPPLAPEAENPEKFLFGDDLFCQVQDR